MKILKIFDLNKYVDYVDNLHYTEDQKRYFIEDFTVRIQFNCIEDTKYCEHLDDDYPERVAKCRDILFTAGKFVGMLSK